MDPSSRLPASVCMNMPTPFTPYRTACPTTFQRTTIRNLSTRTGFFLIHNSLTPRSQAKPFRFGNRGNSTRRFEPIILQFQERLPSPDAKLNLSTVIFLIV